MVANKNFGHPQKWILTCQICNLVVLDHLTMPLLPEVYNRLIGFFQLQLNKGGRGWEAGPHS